jgi:hypothetical protein
MIRACAIDCGKN